jgi:hypothetical protein
MILRLAGAAFAAFVFCAVIRPVAVEAAIHSDVLVVGGTPAGVAAAVAAARSGDTVTLVSQHSRLGGVLTDATMDQWDLNLAPNGASVEGGIFREIYGALGDAFTPARAADVFADLVQSEPRIHTFVDAQPVATQVSGVAGATRIDAVTFAGAGDERFKVRAAVVIDATDAGDLAALAGARYDVGRQDTGLDERMQPVTLMFTLTGVDWPALAHAYDLRADGPGGADARRAWGYGTVMDDYWPSSPDVLVRDLNFGREPDGTVTVNAIDVLGIDARFPAELERARAIAVSEAPRLIAFLRDRLPGLAGARIDHYAGALYVRETRHVLGLEWLTATDVWNGVLPNDRIALGSYPLDLHPVIATDHLAYAPLRHVYGIPFGTLVPRGFSNLLIASPAISASHIASGSARVVPTTIEEGQAAGTAAALALARHQTLLELAQTPAGIATLQNDLRRDGAILDYTVPATIARR